MGETSLADTVRADTVVAVGVRRAGSSGDTAEVGTRLELLGADGVGGSGAVTLNVGAFSVGSGVDEIAGCALGGV